jgi:5-oxoprolinase (ATP-hydrolysing)
MQSSGGLTDARRFRGPNALLSGPAGGVVAAARVAGMSGWKRAIGFDMGGTSTDVSLIEDGEVERVFETSIGGIRVKSPMLRIHTVAAGGGSLCRFDGLSQTVGPESAGAKPGPVVYGNRDSEGNRLASELALTDINFALGRVQPDRFPFPLDPAPIESILESHRSAFESAGLTRSLDEIAAGFVEIANANMAQAIAEVSVSRGVDPRDHALVGFGGAAGQHACAIARILGMPRVLLHPLAGLLSAYGIGLSDASWDGQRDVGRRPLPIGAEGLDRELEAIFSQLLEQGHETLREEGIEPDQIRNERCLDLRYSGTDVPLVVTEANRGQSVDAWRSLFESEHERRFGYVRPGRTIEIATARVRCRAESPGSRHQKSSFEADIADLGDPDPIRSEEVYFALSGRVATPVYERESLRPGHRITGPALILEDAGTIVLEIGFEAEVLETGVLALIDRAESSLAPGSRDLREADPVRLEVFGNRFMSIAEQMGAVLRNTSVSTNIKERLDYSCAVFDSDGGLIANAPHIPVHLGAMGETVRAVRDRFPDLAPGDVVVTNDPFEGGSHLPDITVVTPLFRLEASPGENETHGAEALSNSASFYVASRGHHADVGGITPGSMPSDSENLSQEGVLLEAFRLVRAGEFDERRLREALASGPYPARAPDDNVADLQAMVAANRAGAHLLESFVAEQGFAVVTDTMHQLQTASAQMVAREIGKLPDGSHRFKDQLDDGTPIEVCLEVSGERMRIDFTGTGSAVPGNLNAPRAVVHAAVIYVLRALVAERVPLNGGCLEPVEIVIPKGSLLDPPRGSAVVGGNVETSQRLVDVLLGALGIAAASQGTMNNVTFGNQNFGHYETIGGGAGAGPGFPGASAVHTHMTNTRITDAEVLEDRFPVRLARFAIRRGSGGLGQTRGGDGIERHYLFTAPVTATLLTERRSRAPYGAEGGAPGKRGHNWIERGIGDDKQRRMELAGKCSITMKAGDLLAVETPGGGGYGPTD